MPIHSKRAAAFSVQSATTVRVVRKATTSAVAKKAVPKKKVPPEVVQLPAAQTKPKKVGKTVRAQTTPPKTKSEVVVTPSKQEVVFVPSTASLRLLEKIELYRIWYAQSFPTYMSTVAKVGGYTFVLLGTLLASFSYLSNKDLFGPAATVCTEVDCVTIADAELPPEAPLITFLNSLPTEITSDTDFVLRAENTAEPKVSLQHLESGERVSLSPMEVMERGEFKYLIKHDLKPGTYIVQAEARDGVTTYKFSTTPVTIPGEVAVTVPIVRPALDDSLSTSTASGTAMVEETALVPVETTDGDTAATTPLHPLTVRVVDTANATYLRINVGDFAPDQVEVYSRVTGSSEALYLGLATQVQGEWIFSLSALDLPHYEHQLYASFAARDKAYQTEATTYIPADFSNSNLTSESELFLLVEKIELALATADVKNATRQQYLSHIASTTPAFFDTAHEVTFADDSLLTEADTQLQLYNQSIDRLLSYYAAAVQGGQKYLLDLVDSKFVAEYKLIAQSYPDTESITTLETLYALRFQDLKDRVRDMEQQVGDQTNNLMARDTDSDGFSDFDEIANYDTDPAKADTDKDGVLDAIESISGFNPLVSDIQNLVTLTQNSEERIFNEVLTIKGVEAITQKSAGADITYAVLSGTSIPNSYVTILSYTLGTIGVIRTNLKGDFSYTIEKDLVEGEYEVAAVLTDNNGNVVASSKPYIFTKTKHDLVAAAVGETLVFIPQNATSETLPAAVTASVAVTAFGFLLVLLSQTLHKRRRELVPSIARKPRGA